MNSSQGNFTKTQFVAKSKLYKPALRKEFVNRKALYRTVGDQYFCTIYLSLYFNRLWQKYYSKPMA